VTASAPPNARTAALQSLDLVQCPHSKDGRCRRGCLVVAAHLSRDGCRWGCCGAAPKPGGAIIASAAGFPKFGEVTMGMRSTLQWQLLL
jgi:hypothetical protein